MRVMRDRSDQDIVHRIVVDLNESVSAYINIVIDHTELLLDTCFGKGETSEE
jgi:hypothetical protein